MYSNKLLIPVNSERGGGGGGGGGGRGGARRSPEARDGLESQRNQESLEGGKRVEHNEEGNFDQRQLGDHHVVHVRDDHDHMLHD